MRRLVLALLALPLIAGCAEKQEPTPAPPPAPAPLEFSPLATEPDADTEHQPGDPAHEDLRDEKPPGVTEKEIEEGEAQSDRAERYSLERPSNGGAQNYACATRYVVNRSSRGGTKPTMFVLHYTVSRPGSLDAIRGLFNTRSFGASSHYGLEGSGRCQQWVPEKEKAWTQGAANPRSISVEIIATGREPRSWWLAQPIFTRGILASIARDSMRRNGIPLTRVDPVGCGAPAGWTDHDSLECGNSHTDVRPSFPYDVFSKQLRAGTVDAPSKVKTWCRKVSWFRALPRRSQTTTKRRLAEERVKLAAKTGYTCGPTGPVKR